MSDLPRCPKCGEIVKEIWDNNGFDGIQGPRHDEVVGYECTVHGDVEPVYDEGQEDLDEE